MEQMFEKLSKIKTFHELLLFASKLHNDKVAFIDADNESNQTTFSQLLNTSLKISNFLFEDVHLKKQETVAVLMPNRWEYFAVHSGTNLLGGIFTAVSSHFTNFEISHQLRDSDTVVVFVDKDYLQKVLSVLPECPKIRKIVVLGDYNEDIKASVDVISWDAIDKYPPKIPPTPEIDPAEDVCWLPYSSGTTGLPKGVMITHKNYIDHFKVVTIHHLQKLFKNTVIPPNDVTISFMPIYHAMGYAYSIGNVIRGYSTIIMKNYSLEKLLYFVEKYKLTILRAAPTVAHQLAKSPIAKKYDLSSIVAIGTGGSKLDEGTMKMILKQFPNVQLVYQGYGMTEVVAGLTLSTGKKTDPLNCTGVPLPGVDIKIFDPETNEVLLHGQVGEVRFKAPYTMKGYWKNPEATRACYDDKGYFKTGDIGYLDKEGLLFITDRIKELIKVKAFQVPPAELEAVLMTHPLISDCAAIGIPDKVNGEVPKAFVVRSSKKLTEEEVIKFIADRLSYYKHLKGGVEFIQEIPRTGSGKIMRRYLKETETSRTKSKL